MTTTTLELNITDALCKTFLTACVESASAYWLACKRVKRDAEGNVTKIIGCEDAEDGATKWADADLDTIRLGIKRLLSPGAEVASNIKAEVLAAVSDPDDCGWDDWTADSCLQFGMFNELVYG